MSLAATYQSVPRIFNSESVCTSGSAVFRSCFAIFRDQIHKNMEAVYFARFSVVTKTALPEVCTDWMLKYCGTLGINIMIFQRTLVLSQNISTFATVYYVDVIWA